MGMAPSLPLGRRWVGEVWEGSAQQTKEGMRQAGLVLWERCEKAYAGLGSCRPGVPP